MTSKIQHTRETEKHGFGISLAPELALLVLFLLRSLTGTQIQVKGNAVSVGHGETLGKLTRKGINLPQNWSRGNQVWQKPAAPSIQPLPDLAVTTTPSESCSPLMLVPGRAAVPWGLSSQSPSGASLGRG